MHKLSKEQKALMTLGNKIVKIIKAKYPNLPDLFLLGPGMAMMGVKANDHNGNPTIVLQEIGFDKEYLMVICLDRIKTYNNKRKDKGDIFGSEFFLADPECFEKLFQWVEIRVPFARHTVKIEIHKGNAVIYSDTKTELVNDLHINPWILMRGWSSIKDQRIYLEKPETEWIAKYELDI